MREWNRDLFKGGDFFFEVGVVPSYSMDTLCTIENVVAHG